MPAQAVDLAPSKSAAPVKIRALDETSSSREIYRLPFASRRPAYRWFASTDPKNENADYILLKPGETRRVPLTAGALERLWSTASQPTEIELSVQNGGARTVLIGPRRAAVGSLVDKTFLFYPRGVASSVNRPEDAITSLDANAALIATNRSKAPNKWFYQATIRPLVPGVAGDGRDSLVSDAPTSAASGAPRMVKATQLLKTGQSLGAVDVSGGFRFGFVDQVKITIAPTSIETWNRCILRGFATQREKPLGSLSEQNKAPQTFDPRFAINAPLLAMSGQFLGVGGKSDAASSFDGKTLTLRWPLPFDARRDSPALDVVNTSSGRVTVTIEARVQGLTSPPPSIFHAHFGSSATKKGVPVQIAKVQGEGAFVGLALAIRPIATSRRRAFAYLEGNETIKADAQVLEGTGTEDFFNSAWYFPETPFARAFGGMSFKSALPPQVAAHRWAIPDPIPFKRNLDFTFEHGNGNNSDDLEWRWLACFYAAPQATWAVPDELAGNPESGTIDPRREAGREERVRKLVLGTLGAILGIVVLIGLFSVLRRGAGTAK